MSRWKNSLWFLGVAFSTAAFVWARDVRIPKHIAYVTEEEGGISVIDLGTLRVIRRIQPSDVQPRGIAVTFDGKYLITANKNTSDIAVFNLPRLRLVKRIHIGHSPEFIKVDSAGDRLFAAFEPGSSAGPPGAPGAKDSADEQDEPPAQASALAGKLQVFDPDWLNLLAEVPAGDRSLQSTVVSHCSLSSLHPTCTLYGKFTLCLTWRKAGAIYFGLASPPIIPGPMSIRSSGEHDYSVLLGSDGFPAARFG